MKILEFVFLGLTIIVPSLLIVLAFKKINTFKRNKKFRKTIMKFILLSFIINGIIYGSIKVCNDKVNNEEIKQNEKRESTLNKTEKGFNIQEKNGVTYIDGYLIVNKTYSLPENFVPTDTYQKITSSNCAECINKDAFNAYNKMKNEAIGMNLWIASGYRSYSYQNGLYTSYVNRSGQTAADTYSARPGHSEHQTGLAFDLNTVSDSFANTKEGIWINQNCHKYGFIIRYPKDKDHITGYKYEPWHLRYVGIDLATKLYNNGDWISMEEYFGITSTYAN